jgi:carboxylesterase
MLVAACTQLSSGDAPASVLPPLDYSDAIASVARRQASDQGIVVPNEGSILLTSGHLTPSAFVLLHGFSDSPTQFKAVGEYLFAAGHNVYIPRLPHHAERHSPVRALGRVRAGELASFGDSVVDVARGLGDTVVVVGFSAGGTIAASIAQMDAGVQRVVLIAPALSAGRVSDEESNLIVDVATRLPDVIRSEAEDRARPGFEQGMSTWGLGEVLVLGREVRRSARASPPGAREIVFLLNQRDETVSNNAELELAQSWSSRGASVKVYRFPRSLNLPHNVMQTDPAHGGRAALVYPVIEALAMDGPVPRTADLMPDVPCLGWTCTFVRWVREL